MSIQDFKFELQSHISYSTGGERWEKATNKGLVVYRLIATRKSLINGWGKGKVSYFIGKEKKEYKDVDEFLKVVADRTALKLTPQSNPTDESRPDPDL